MTDAQYVMSHPSFVKLARVRKRGERGFLVELNFPQGTTEVREDSMALTFETARHVLEHYDHAAANQQRSAS